jgi:hypothetical protein
MGVMYPDGFLPQSYHAISRIRSFRSLRRLAQTYARASPELYVVNFCGIGGERHRAAAHVQRKLSEMEVKNLRKAIEMGGRE